MKAQRGLRAGHIIMIFALLLGTLQHSGADASWGVGQVQRDGKPVVYKFISALPPQELRAKLPWLTVVAWKYDGSARNGMPPRDINQRMQTLEDQLETIAGKGQLYLDVYTSTGNDLKEFVFHIADRDQFIRQLDLALKNQPYYPLNITFYQDPDWTDVATLLQDFGAQSLQKQTTQASRCDISGSWRHPDKPAKLYIDPNQQLITVLQHTQAPQAVGLTVVRQLQPEPDHHARWSGQMYDGDRQAYVPVTVRAQDCQNLVISDEHKVVLRLVRGTAAEASNTPR